MGRQSKRYHKQRRNKIFETLTKEIRELNKVNRELNESAGLAWDSTHEEAAALEFAKARVCWLEEKIRVDRNVGLFFSALLIVLNLVLLWFLL